jgi:hypothetical protein
VRGSVLVDVGRLEEGAQLLVSALERNVSSENRAYNAAYLAIASIRSGDRDAAQRHFDYVQTLNADCSLISRLTQEFAAFDG